MRLSIIIPAYKVEDYIEKCIRSLENQDLPKDEYEIIVTNDGSPDRCRSIVESLQQEFSNIILINQENQGVSVARNNGILLAKGDYILFVDPDDFIEANSINEKLTTIEEKHLDVGICEFTILNEIHQPIYDFRPTILLKEPLRGIDFFNKFFKGNSKLQLPDRSWGIFLRRVFIINNNLFYLSDVHYLEDGELLYRIYCLANRVDFINNPLYYLMIRAGSATSGNLFYSKKARTGFLKSAVNLKQFQSNFEPTSKEYQFINQPIAKYLFLYLTSVKLFNFFYYLIVSTRIKNEFPRLETEGANKFYAKFANYYNASIRYFYFQYIINQFVYKFKKQP